MNEFGDEAGGISILKTFLVQFLMVHPVVAWAKAPTTLTRKSTHISNLCTKHIGILSALLVFFRLALPATGLQAFF